MGDGSRTTSAIVILFPYILSALFSLHSTVNTNPSQSLQTPGSIPDLRMRRDIYPRTLDHMAISRRPAPHRMMEEGGAGRLDTYFSQ